MLTCAQHVNVISAQNQLTFILSNKEEEFVEYKSRPSFGLIGYTNHFVRFYVSRGFSCAIFPNSVLSVAVYPQWSALRKEWVNGKRRRKTKANIPWLFHRRSERPPEWLYEYKGPCLTSLVDPMLVPCLITVCPTAIRVFCPKTIATETTKWSIVIHLNFS